GGGVAATAPVDSVAGDGVEGVGDGEDACVEIDLLALQAQRVARPVPPLVVLSHDARGPFEELDAAKYPLPVQRVLPHPDPLLLRQRRGLAQYRVGHPDLADVVEERAELQRARLLAAQAEFAPEPEAEADYPLRVSVRLGVARFERGCERLERGAVGVFERTEGAVQLR